MESSACVPRIELKYVAECQRSLYGVAAAGDKLSSPYYRGFVKTFWHTNHTEKFECVPKKDGTVDYIPNKNMHTVDSSYLTFYYPQISVKAEWSNKVRIAWPHNAGSNVILGARCYDKDVEYNSWDRYYYDDHYQFFEESKAGIRENHAIGIGNVPIMENWTEFLPRYPINIRQPWFYSFEKSNAFPLFYKGFENTMKHTYRFRRDIEKLLRVQVKVIDRKTKKFRWVDKTGGFMHYLDIVGGKKIPVPELWGEYGYLQPYELEIHKKKPIRKYFTRDISNIDTVNPHVYGQVVNAELIGTRPVLGFTLKAVNLDAEKIHNYSNYTTNTHDLNAGWNPISSVSFYYGQEVKKFENLQSHHLSIAKPRDHAKSCPIEPGYNLVNWAEDMGGSDAEMTMVFNGRKPVAKIFLWDTDVFKNPLPIDENDVNSSDKKDIDMHADEILLDEDEVTLDQYEEEDEEEVEEVEVEDKFIKKSEIYEDVILRQKANQKKKKNSTISPTYKTKQRDRAVNKDEVKIKEIIENSPKFNIIIRCIYIKEWQVVKDGDSMSFKIECLSL